MIKKWYTIVFLSMAILSSSYGENNQTGLSCTSKIENSLKAYKEKICNIDETSFGNQTPQVQNALKAYKAEICSSEQTDPGLVCEDGYTLVNGVCVAQNTTPNAFTPVLLFSDMIYGPNSGWSSTEPNKGAVITIWGKNFGDTRGDSFVTVNGVDLTSDSDYAEEWGKYNSPTPFLQSISFWLNNQMPSGEGSISVTINGETSQEIPFTIGEGDIFFVDYTANSNGDGSLQSPWNKFKRGSIYKAIGAGDVVYFREGVMNKHESGKSNIYVPKGNLVATKEKPIALVGYPGEKMLFDSYTNGDGNFYRGIKVDVPYITIAKLHTNSYEQAIQGSAYNRIISNDLQGMRKYKRGNGIIFNGRDGAVILGNSVHGARSNHRLDHSIYIGGCYPTKGAEVAYNYSYDNVIGRGPHISVNHQEVRCGKKVPDPDRPGKEKTIHDHTLWVKSHYIHNNVVDCRISDQARSEAPPLDDEKKYTTTSRGIGIYHLSWQEGVNETEPEPSQVYNNVLKSCGNGGALYHNNGHANFFNNTLIDSIGSSISVGTQRTDEPHLSTQIVNNIMYYSTPSQTEEPNKCISVQGSRLIGDLIVEKNVCFNANSDIVGPRGGLIPNIDTISADPNIVIDIENSNFSIKQGSPAINEGNQLINYGFDREIRDLNLRLRPIGGRIDVGAVEFYEE